MSRYPHWDKPVLVTDLRAGNLVTVKYDDEKEPRRLEINAFQLGQMLMNKGLTLVGPEILDESIMKLLRRKRILHTGEIYSAIEFDQRPPGERQVENNYWSREISTFTRLHLSPAYTHEKDSIGNYTLKKEQPDFWYCWICEYGTGSSGFNSLVECGQLRYVNQLQNIFYLLTGEELTLQKDFK